MDKTKEQIRHEIEETRARMGDTLQALTQKADVRGRAGERVREMKTGARQAVGKAVHSVEGTAERSPRKILSYGRRHPIGVVLGIGALAAGLVSLFKRR